MQIVTLTSDWSKEDYYSGAVKGKILSAIDQVQVVTLSNRVKPYSISEAAFIVRNTFRHFPSGTIHLVAVNAAPVPDPVMVAASIDGHFFVSSDNGFFGLLGDVEPDEIIELKNTDKPVSSFPELDILVPAVISLIQGESVSSLGNPYSGFSRQTPLRATLENSTITGTVIHIDSYGNAITNITRELFERIGSKRDFEIFVQSRHYKIDSLNSRYADSDPGDLLALFNSVGLLEIAIRNGSASGLLNVNTDSTIRVRFKE